LGGGVGGGVSRGGAGGTPKLERQMPQRIAGSGSGTSTNTSSKEEVSTEMAIAFPIESKPATRAEAP